MATGRRRTNLTGSVGRRPHRYLAGELVIVID
jgi:hypothetical protein